jgi:hypothetical protein
MTVRGSFIEQALNCENLDSPFMGQLLRLLAKNLTIETSVGQRVLNWPGDPTYRVDAVGLRLAGALHALVLNGECPELIAVYPPKKVNTQLLWSAIETALVKHESHILNWLIQPPQTNEVRRSSAIMPACLHIQSKFGLPLVISELGASAGLNLNWDRFHLSIDGLDFGDKASSVQLAPKWSGPLPPQVIPNVIARAGCDLNPLNPNHDALRLLAYTWPDQKERMIRTKAAITIAQDNPTPVDKSDAEAWLNNRLSKPYNGAVHVIYHTVAWQYFPTKTQEACKELIYNAGRNATIAAPIVWIGMEADDDPNGAGLRITSWPNGYEQKIARVDFHGRWVQWMKSP